MPATCAGALLPAAQVNAMSASSTQDNRPGPATTGVAGTPPGKATADGRSSRRHWPGLLPALFMLAGLAGSVVTGATAGEPATLLFASTCVPAVEPGGGLGITSTAFPGHTFRLTEPAHVTALGGRLTGSSGRSVFAALYRVDTPWTPPDVPGDSRLLASTLLVPASNAVQDVSGPVDLILEPGWYAIVLGLDRHGATATSHQVSLATNGMPQAPMSRGTYSVDPATGATVTHLPRFRLFVAGHWLAPEPQSPQAFVVASAEPWAWTSGGTTLDAGNTYAMRFHLEHSTRIGQVDTWLMNASGSFYAAIFPLAGSWARPPLPNSAGFADQAIASTLIAGQPGFHKASATFDDLCCRPVNALVDRALVPAAAPPSCAPKTGFLASMLVASGPLWPATQCACPAPQPSWSASGTAGFGPTWSMPGKAAA